MGGSAGAIGVVVIGRNEGMRLKVCLRSLPHTCSRIYVDSGSQDDSVAYARELGIETIELDAALPFTAARARNTGLAALLARHPTLEFVQMLDGDCEFATGWLETAAAALSADPKLAAVFGRRRESYPGRSLYNRLCDDEWAVPIGDAPFFGGDVLLRPEALLQVGGYREDMISAEDSEVGFRIRRAGWRIRRLDAEMTLHDAALMRFGQWWRRMLRGGHGFAELIWRHGLFAHRPWSAALGRIIAWGLVLPITILITLSLGLGMASAFFVLTALLLLAYPARLVKLAIGEIRRGRPPREAVMRGSLAVACKFAELVGALRFWAGRIAGGQVRIVEYKSAGAS